MPPESVTPASEFETQVADDQLEHDLSDVDRRRLRRLVHQRIFGGSSEEVAVGRYTVLQRLGHGGMGVVYSAYDQQLDRKVAIKLLHHEDEHPSSQRRARLLREAKALARLSHPNVVQVHDVGETGGRVYVAMELISGQTLDEWNEAQPRSRREIIEAYLQAGRGLAAAHAAGIVHRDFKPANVLVGEDGRIRVVDFGLARSEQGEPGVPESEGGSIPTDAPGLDASLTKTGAVIGTPAYMAPEQLLGQATDPRSDQFSFCVSLYESLYAQRPFTGKSYAELVKNLLAGRIAEAPLSSRTPAWLRALLTRGLSIDPEHRFPDMAALLEELSRDRITRRRRRLLVAGALGLASVAAVAWGQREREHATASEALIAEAQQESQRADDAEQDLRRREDAVTLSEASGLLDESPVHALARLQLLSEEMPWAGGARTIAADAWQRGVPDALIELAPELEAVRVARQGRYVAFVEGGQGPLHLVDVDRGTVEPLGHSWDGGSTAVAAEARVFAMIRDHGDQLELVVRDLDRGTDRRTPIPRPAPIWLEISPDGSRVLGQMEDLSAWVFEPDGRLDRLPMRVHNFSLALSPDELLVEDSTGRLVRWSSTGGARTIFEGPLGDRWWLSPAGDRVASPTAVPGQVIVIPLDGSPVRRFESLSRGSLLTGQWDASGRQLALGSDEGEALVLRPDTGSTTPLPEHDGPILMFSFSADGGTLASMTWSGTCRTTRLQDGVAQHYPGHPRVLSLRFDETGHLRSLDLEATLRVWSAEPRHELAWAPTPSGYRDRLAWSTGGLAMAGRGHLRVVDADDLEPRWQTTWFAPYLGLAWSEDDSWLATTHQDGSLRLWSADGEVLETFAGHGGAGGQPRVFDERIVWPEAGTKLHVLEPDTGARALFELPELDAIADIDVDPERGWLWVAGRTPGTSGTLFAVDLDDGSRVFEEPLGRRGVQRIAVLPADGRVARVNFYGEVLLFDPATGETQTLGAHSTQVRGLAVGPHGSVLFTSSSDGSARVWDLQTGSWREVGGRTMVDSSAYSPVFAVAVSPDGERFATSEFDGSVRVWRDELPHQWPRLREWITDSTDVDPRQGPPSRPTAPWLAERR